MPAYVVVGGQWGDEGKGDVTKITLFTGVWQPNQTYSYPFEFHISSLGPVTYHGHHINLDWYLEATADIPWAKDPAVKQEILVVPHSHQILLMEKIASKEMGSFEYGCSIWFFCILSLGVALYPSSWKFWPFDISILIVKGIGLLIVLGLATLVLYKKIMTMLTMRKLGNVKTNATLSKDSDQDYIQCSVQLTPRSVITLSEVSLTLFSCETTVNTSGTTPTTYKREIPHSATTQKPGTYPTSVPVGLETKIDIAIPIPPDTPWNLKAGRNTVEWFVRLRLHLAGLPDWTCEFPVTINPVN
jgi:hypothetical protein